MHTAKLPRMFSIGVPGRCWGGRCWTVTVDVAAPADAGVASLTDAGVGSLTDAGVASLSDAVQEPVRRCNGSMFVRYSSVVDGSVSCDRQMGCGDCVSAYFCYVINICLWN